jgi:uncharacterized protein (TIGR00730 family)
MSETDERQLETPSRTDGERSFGVSDPALAANLRRLLKDLEPYPHLDQIEEVLVAGVKLALDGADRGDLKILRAAIKEMRHAFRVFAAYPDTRKVSVFGSARTRPDDPVFATAVEVGRRLAAEGFMVITGAGDGVMGAAHLGAGRDASFGLNILLPFEQSANPVIEDDPKLINFRYFFTRKLFFVKESDAVVLMPGGFGTMDEGFETLTLLQTGKCPPLPLVMLDSEGGGYWDAWLEFVRGTLVGRGMISEEDLSLFRVTRSVGELVREIREFYRRYHSSRYVQRRSLLVFRLREALPPGRIEALNADFADILAAGRIEATAPFPEEEDEPKLASLPRIVFPFNQINFGRLRQLIDAINAAP